MQALSNFTNAIRATIACADAGDAQFQQRLAEAARHVLQQSCGLVDEAQQALLNPQDSAHNQQRLAHTARTIAQSLYACVNCLPGQDEMDQVINQVRLSVQSFLKNKENVSLFFTLPFGIILMGNKNYSFQAYILLLISINNTFCKSTFICLGAN